MGVVHAWQNQPQVRFRGSSCDKSFCQAWHPTRGFAQRQEWPVQTCSTETITIRQMHFDSVASCSAGVVLPIASKQKTISFVFAVAEATKSAITVMSNSIAGGTQEQQVLGGEGTEFELDCRNK